MNILIVDDEKNILEEIVLLMNQCAGSVHKLFSTVSSTEAVDIISKNTIDLLITDIRLSLYDGFYLASLVKEKKSSAHIVFISAYDDKAYLKSAITFKSDNYFEKPICHSDFLSQMTRIIQTIELESTVSIQQSLTEMRLLTQYLLSSDRANTKQDHFLIEKYQLHEKQFLPIAIKIFSKNAAIASDKYLLQVFNRLLSNDTEHNFILYENRKHCFSLFIYGKIVYKNKIINILNEMMSSSQSHAKFLISIGNAASDFKILKKNYLDTVVSLEYGFYGSYGIVETMPLTSNNTNNFYPAKEIVHFGNLLRHGNYQTISDYTDQLFDRMENAALSATSVMHIFHQILTAIYYFADEHHIIFTLSFEEISTIEFNLFSEVKEYFQIQLKTFYDEYTRNDYVVNKIRSYITEHYQDADLSIKSIAQALNLSNSYACSQFKKVTNLTINDYLSKIRINEAKKLIIQGDQTINQIAMQVGYSDPNYFSRLFKKTTGLTATEYKNSFFNQQYEYCRK